MGSLPTVSHGYTSGNRPMRVGNVSPRRRDHAIFAELLCTLLPPLPMTQPYTAPVRGCPWSPLRGGSVLYAGRGVIVPRAMRGLRRSHGRLC